MTIPNRWFNTFLYAVSGGLLTGVLTLFLVHLIVDAPFADWIVSEMIWLWLFCCFLLPSFVFFILLGIAFRSFSKSNISYLYKIVPDLNPHDPAKDFEGLSEHISSLNTIKSKEIDLLTERENYRREFLGNVSHELKTPLFSIQGYLLTLIEGGIEDETIRDKYLNRINKSVERLTYIVKDLDLITKLESGNLKLEKKPFNLTALTLEVFELLEIKASNNGVKLEIDNPADIPVLVVGDIERIEQVLTNLIVNAINHSYPQSKVTVKFRNAGNKVHISVKDTGTGIEPEHISRIFERFYRVDKSRSRNYGGSGLGLSIVKHILEAHGEKIQVKSVYKEGAEFSFFLQRV